MRVFHIFSLHLEKIFEHRLRSFIWFLNPLANAGIMFLFWRGALSDSGGTIDTWNMSTITSYYFLLMIAGSFLTSHTEEDVAYSDIKEGNIVRYLIKPFPYYWAKFLEEIPFRLLQGFYGVCVLLILIALLGPFVSISHDPIVIILALSISILASFLSFTFKMIIGLLAFWITDIGGTYQVIEVCLIILAGSIMPIELYPEMLKNFVHATPFPYMIYYPIMAFQGKLLIPELLQVLASQFFWLAFLVATYKVLLSNGIKKFTGVGQ